MFNVLANYWNILISYRHQVRKVNVLQIILLIVFSVGATVSYADPPASKGKTFSSKIQKTVPQKSSNTVSLSWKENGV